MADIIILSVLSIAIGFAIRHILKQKRQGGNCANCSASCSLREARKCHEQA